MDYYNCDQNVSFTKTVNAPTSALFNYEAYLMALLATDARASGFVTANNMRFCVITA